MSECKNETDIYTYIQKERESAKRINLEEHRSPVVNEIELVWSLTGGHGSKSARLYYKDTHCARDIK